MFDDFRLSLYSAREHDEGGQREMACAAKQSLYRFSVKMIPAVKLLCHTQSLSISA
jgi:hypothetical protein